MTSSTPPQRPLILALSSVLLAIPLTQCVSGVDPEPPATGTGGSTATSTATGFTVTSSSAASGSATSSTSAGSASSSTTTAASSASSSSSAAASSSSSSSSSVGGAPSSSSTGVGGAGGSISSSSASGSGGAGGMGTHCLQNIPPNCPVCETMNASDKPKCMEYLACYLNNNCNPVVDPCGQQDGTCGVNTIGGGYAPRDASIVTYQCACP